MSAECPKQNATHGHQNRDVQRRTRSCRPQSACPSSTLRPLSSTQHRSRERHRPLAVPHLLAKGENQFIVGKPRSNYRVASVALMVVNKFVDKCLLLLHCLYVHSCLTPLFFDCYHFATHTDTYTNKTSSKISGISLSELNKMGHKFLLSSNA